MQKKHLHLFLLLLALTGCSPQKFSEVNPYFTKKGNFAIDFDRDAQATLLYGGVDLRTHGLSSPSFRLICWPYIDGACDIQWGNARGEPLDLSHRSISRSLLSLELADTTVGFIERTIPLPDGRGAVFYLDSKVSGPFVASLTMASDDTLWPHQARILSDKLIAFDGPDSTVVLIGSGDGIVSARCITAPGTAPAWEFTIAKTRTPQLVMAFGRKLSEVRPRIEKYMGLSPKRMAAAAVAGLEKQAGFSIHTSDERANETAALLSCALIGADVRVPKRTRLQTEESSQLAPALFLASRQKPLIVFPPSEKFFTEQAKRDNLRWGSTAFRTALSWGMADDDTLHWLSLDILSGLERLQAEYVTSDIAVVADETPPDSLMRLTIEHVRLAGLMSLGEDICFARGDHEAQNDFRRESLWASKRAQDYFTKSSRMYSERVSSPPMKLDAALDTTTAVEVPETDDSDEPPVDVSFPDTSLFLLAGARYGFGWLDNRPTVMWNRRLSVGGFTWQKWIAYRIRGDVLINETPDFDSLSALILDGPVPGLLTGDPGYTGEPSMPVMAASLENLAEIYLGIKPDAFAHKVWLEPRLPATWGHTTARVPYSTGYLHLDYDFAHNYAIVAMSGITCETQIFLGYPLPSGGFMRTQFTLVPGEHGQRIDLKHREDNRLQLFVTDAP